MEWLQNDQQESYELLVKCGQQAHAGLDEK
jgi:hypothetical protein